MPAEKFLLTLHRIKLPQSAGEPERINSQRRTLGAFPGIQTCQGLLDTNKTSGSESSLNCKLLELGWGFQGKYHSQFAFLFYSFLSQLRATTRDRVLGDLHPCPGCAVTLTPRRPAYSCG